MPQRFIRVVNWSKYQHYRDRNPPWIKLHRELLTSRTWVSLDDASRVLVIACMLLASATNNQIPMDPECLRRVAYLNSEPDFSRLLEVGFLEMVEESTNASKPLAATSNSQANARPETKTETEQKTTPAVRNSKTFSSTEVAQSICVANGWSGRQMIWALQEAIEFQSTEMPETSLQQVGEWLAKAYHDRRASKGDFAGGPQKFFQQALYRTGSSRNGKVLAPGDDLVARTLAQLESK